ncbi:lysylphosphatidylglycerol synthase transmembrane domain-containing protein [Nocardioides sp.]|uniref:lysylphosphatidylglycerol synthase transmembrane domain-containing protein n=1 Tax=Nocardioides sp. TaxID=35761 RepID=UPI0035AE7864
MRAVLRSSWRSSWRWLGGALVLALVVREVGSGPVLEGLRALDVRVLVAGVALALVTTIASAWRWTLVARELGVALTLPRAVAACYRAQHLNTILPGGVLGDVHRGVVHGRSTGETGRALRAVGWERFAGQLVQALLAVVVLAVLPSPARPALPWLVAAVALVAVLAVVLLRRTPDRDAWWSRAARVVRDDVRLALLVRRSWPGVVLASVVATAGYVATLVLAARAVGVDAPVATLLPLALVVLVAAGLPLNLAGWGPREGTAAWAFAAAGLGASAGMATAVAYGAIVLVANLPGLAVLAAGRRTTPAPDPVRGEPAHA